MFFFGFGKPYAEDWLLVVNFKDKYNWENRRRGNLDNSYAGSQINYVIEIFLENLVLNLARIKSHCLLKTKTSISSDENFQKNA